MLIMGESRGPGGATYTAKEVADKDDKDSSGNVLASVETPEGMRLAVAIEDMVVFDLLYGC